MVDMKDRKHCIVCGDRIWPWTRWEWWRSEHVEVVGGYWVCSLACWEELVWANEGNPDFEIVWRRRHDPSV